MQVPNALVISADPVAAALLGTAVELAGFRVEFLADGEAVRGTLRRVRPVLVLADCDHDDTRSDSFIGPALMIGARLAIFCSASHVARERTRAITDRHGLAFFVLPDEVEPLQEWVVSVAEAVPGHAVRRGA